jgi:chromosome partitioning protein
VFVLSEQGNEQRNNLNSYFKLFFYSGNYYFHLYQYSGIVPYQRACRQCGRYCVGVVIATVNQKGGVAKTTTVVNLGAALSAKGRTVLLIDLDPQASLSRGLGVPVHELNQTMHEVMLSEALITDVILPTGIDGVDVAPADITMTTLERQLSGQVAFDSLLDRALEPIKNRYDYILIDCRPSLESLEVNAVRAADYLIIPIFSERYALYGTDQLLEFIYMVRERLKPSLEILGVVLTKVDKRNTLTEQVITEVQTYFKDKVFDTQIGINVRLAEVPGVAPSIFDYDPASRGARDYQALASEVIARVES